MATHDYVIANGTGAAVRSDLNNALAAIVSNNSSSSEPSTTYAYQWWADTNANLLKIRNSANNGWITLRELDGTMLIEDGSASAPALAFAGDLDTGMFRDTPDQISFATGGTEQLNISSSAVGVTPRAVFSNAVGIGISVPIKSQVQVKGAGQTSALNEGSSTGNVLRLGSTTNNSGDGGAVTFATSGSDTASSLGFAGIKGFLSDGNNNTKGHISFQCRSATTDSAFTENMRIFADGAVYTHLIPAIGSNTYGGVMYTKGYGTLQGTSGGAHSHPFNFYWTGTALQAWVDATNVGNVSLTSDYRTKREITTQSESGIDKIKLLRPVTFKRAEFRGLFQDEEVVREGFIAHEVGEVIPSGCEGEKDAEDQVQSLNIDAIVSVLTKALQEAVAKIETLETKVAALEAG